MASILEAGTVHGLTLSSDVVFIASCHDPAEEVFQMATSLMQQLLDDSSRHVEYFTSKVVEPNPRHPENGHVSRTLQKNWKFGACDYFRIAEVTEGDCKGLYAVGVGTSEKKLKRAANLALAVKVAYWLSNLDFDDWLSEHNISIEFHGGEVLGKTNERVQKRSLKPTALDAPSAKRRASIPPAAANVAPWRAIEPPVRIHGSVRLEKSLQGRKAPLEKKTTREEELKEVEDDKKAPRHRRVSRLPGVRAQTCELPAETHMTGVKEEEDAVSESNQDDDMKSGGLIQEGTFMSIYMKPPQPWFLVYDYGEQRHYYYNPETLQSTWEPPRGSCRV